MLGLVSLVYMEQSPSSPKSMKRRESKWKLVINDGESCFAIAQFIPSTLRRVEKLRLIGSKTELQRQLHNARWSRSRNLSHCGTADGRVRHPEIGSVEGIERLPAQVHAPLLSSTLAIRA